MNPQITVYKQGKTWHAEINGCQGKGTTEMAAINRAHAKMIENREKYQVESEKGMKDDKKEKGK